VGDREEQRHARFVVRSGLERVEVHHQRERGRRGEQDRSGPPRDAALPREVARQERQDGEGGVAHEQQLVVARHVQQDLDPDTGGDREGQDHTQLAPATAVARLLRDEHELLPEPVGVLAGELARDLVEVAHALDRDEERLLVVEPARGQVVDLAPQVVLHLVDVGRRDRPAPLDVAAPLVELPLQDGVLGRAAGRVVGSVLGHQAHPSTTAGLGWTSCQTCLSASDTTVHCCRRSARVSRPAPVIA
jgi:hypothetical protein